MHIFVKQTTIKKRIMKTERIEMIVVSIVFVLAFVLSGIYNR